MPLLSICLEVTSPILQYDSTWRHGTSESDIFADQYTEGSFTLTGTPGSRMRLPFNGSSVTIVGAKRENHGNYTVTVDDDAFPSMNGSAAPNAFNSTLFTNNTLEQGPHILTITNNPTSPNNFFLDVDYILIGTEIGNISESLIVNTFQDVHPYFSYSPPSAWYSPGLASSFSGGTGHATKNSSSVMTLSFQGKTFTLISDGIALYGPVGPNQTDSYIVQIDSGPFETFSSNQKFFRPQQIIYFASNLGGGSHMLSVRLAPTANGEFAVDYANIYSTASLGGSFATTSASEPSIPSSTPVGPSRVFSCSLPHSVIAALVILSVASLTGLFALYYFLKTGSKRDFEERREKTRFALSQMENAEATNRISERRVSEVPRIQPSSPGLSYVSERRDRSTHLRP